MNLTSNILIAALLMLAAPGSFAQPGGAPSATEPDPSIKQVLMLQSLARGNVILDHFSRDLRVGLEQRARSRVNVVQVVVGPTGDVGVPEQALVDYIRSMYRDRAPPGLVVTVGGPAAVFARKHRHELFPETPLLLGSVDEQFLRGTPLGDNESAVTVANDFSRLVDDVLQVLPRTKRVFVVIGSGAIADFWRGRLEIEFRRFRDRVEFVWLDDPSEVDRLRSGAALPRDSAIVYIAGGTDPYAAYDDQQVFGGLGAKASAPLFAPFTPLFGHGIVGGSMISVGDVARTTAGVAVQMLDGAPPGGLRFPPQTAGRPVFDARELQRWDIPESRLPPGSTVQFRAPSAWDQYGRVILVVVAVLVLQSLLIAWLLVERRARQRAEIDSRRSLSLAAAANRRETMATLATSIGHELGQPLSAILHSSQALQMRIAADGAGGDTTAEILAEIQSEAVLATQIIERHRAMLRSHQMDAQPIDLRPVIDESLALVANEMRARQVEVVMTLPPTPCVIDGDPVLLKQVLVNLVRNAADALAAMPPDRRRITIGMGVTAIEVELSVSDTGPGLPAEIADTLFNPFVTTKPMGLGIGLAITQRLIHAHGGTIVAGGNDDGGATFTITLPRSATALASSNGAVRGKETT